MQVDFTQFNCQLNNTNLNYFQIKYCGMTMRKTAKGLSNIDVLITKFRQHIYILRVDLISVSKSQICCCMYKI